ncbi:MAG TPA: hypothetical protein VFX43_10025 [Chitinophagaceae bacterium]|nr:hypothetical protein [Chitinophagaceae bacterium]
MKHVKLLLLVLAFGSFLALGKPAFCQSQTIYFYGHAGNDLVQLLQQENFKVKRYSDPRKALQAAPEGAAVFLVSARYPEKDTLLHITDAMLRQAMGKRLKLYVECPASFPGLDIGVSAVETTLERGVVTSGVFGRPLKPMSLLGIHDCFLWPVSVDHPLIVMAKVVGMDRAEYGLSGTTVYPLLFKRGDVLVSMGGLTNFKKGRYGPETSIKEVWSYILRYMTGDEQLVISRWPREVRPSYGKADRLPQNARMNSIRRGVSWFYRGHFFIHPTWKAQWLKYQGDGTSASGPPLSSRTPNGDGSLGIIQGQDSRILSDGRQPYNYWLRADVQGEASMALAAAGRLFNKSLYKTTATHLIDHLFYHSNLRGGAKNDSSSPVFGLIGWSVTQPGTFYGDDNARAILGMIGASAYLGTDKWDKELAEAIIANFRTTGQEGFRGDHLAAGDIIKNGWQFYHNRHLVYILPHFESWMWACYLWLYGKTHYEPLLDRTERAIRITMDAYPDKWLWGSSMQMQRARMILPLAWLVRVSNTPEHRAWLDRMISEIGRYQDTCGAIREEIGNGPGMFRQLKTNADYGTDEGSLIFKNGEPVSDMLYACNFALFGLHEAAEATASPRYKAMAGKLSDFFTRIQVYSKVHPDLDGAWFRGFNYQLWDFWASNSDKGWGAWCTLTGWIQSWIVTTQIQMQQKQSFWELTNNSEINRIAPSVIKQMLTP